MSADPFANTTTVKNILQHIISPKVVSDGEQGYVSRTDLVNVHNIVFAGGTSNENGIVSTRPFTTQCGVSRTDGTSNIYIYHSRVTTTSVILASVQSAGSVFVISVNPEDGFFLINLSGTSTNFNVGWFIARF